MIAHIEVDAGDVLVTGDAALLGRGPRRFFRSVLGGVPEGEGWRITARSQRSQDLVVRIDTFLRSSGFHVTRGELAERSVELALERRRSIERSRVAVAAWRDGAPQIHEADVLETLASLGWSTQRSLRSHQMRNTLHGLASVNQANFSVPGAGKTVTALATACMHFSAGTIDAILVVGPLASFEPWETETSAAVGDLFRLRRIRGTAAARRQAYSATTKGDLLLISYATAAADRPAIKSLCERLNVMLVVDESHRIKRFSGGVWAPAIIEIAELARIRMILSGTPMPNSGRDLYSQLNVLWPSGLLTGSKSDFAHRVDRGFGRVLPSILPFTIRTSKSELGLPPYHIERHDVPMKELQEEVYTLVLNRMRGVVNEARTWDEKLELLRRARPVRLLQAASNPDLLNHPDDRFKLSRGSRQNLTLLDRLARYTSVERPCKSQAALDIVEPLLAQGLKVVCWSNFLRNLDHMSGLLQHELGVRVIQVDGRVEASDDPSADRPGAGSLEDDTREKRIAEFLHMAGPAVLVANPATCSESISLHRACRHAVYLDRTYDAALFLQSIDRIHRLGVELDSEVTIHILRATHRGGDSIDHLVDASLLSKQAAMEHLLEGAEVHPLARDPSDAEGDAADLEALLRYLVGEELEED